MVINLTGTSPDGDAFDLVKTTVSPIVTSPGNTLERCLEYFSPEFYIYYKFYISISPHKTPQNPTTNKNDKTIALSRGPLNLYFVTKWV